MLYKYVFWQSKKGKEKKKNITTTNVGRNLRRIKRSSLFASSRSSGDSRASSQQDFSLVCRALRSQPHTHNTVPECKLHFVELYDYVVCGFEAPSNICFSAVP